jgi:hypothetical protein
LDIIRGFPDPQGKIRLFQGRWKDKEEMTNAPLAHATGDYIWRLDSDELYKAEDIARISRLLQERPETAVVNLRSVDFFHGLERIMVPKAPASPCEVDRIWKFEKGCLFKGHRPPELYNPRNRSFPGRGPRIEGAWLADRFGVFFYHYAYVTDKQARMKMDFYSQVHLRSFPIGIPLWGAVRRVPAVRSLYGRFFMLPFFDPLRRRLASRSREMNFDYLKTVWEPWPERREAVEAEYGVTFTPLRPWITVPFRGTHPEAMARRAGGDAR